MRLTLDKIEKYYKNWLRGENKINISSEMTVCYVSYFLSNSNGKPQSIKNMSDFFEDNYLNLKVSPNLIRQALDLLEFKESILVTVERSYGPGASPRMHLWNIKNPQAVNLGAQYTLWWLNYVLKS